MTAIERVMAVVEFGLDGTILRANENFLRVMDHSADEIVGKHHRMFRSEAERNAPEYRTFREKLGRGEPNVSQFRRVAKGGKVVWIEASCNPVFDADGRPRGVPKVATDVTARVEAMQALRSWARPAPPSAKSCARSSASPRSSARLRPRRTSRRSASGR